MDQKIPEHIVQYYGTARKFRQAKRRGMRETLAALSNLSVGCAFSPAYDSINIARTALLKGATELSVENWGR